MLDLVIPVYKNIAGLYRSLFSLGTDLKDRVYVTIVDDCSEESYEDVINFFQKFFPIRVVYLEKNMGPGMARQKGLDVATQPYISFLDCGDTYTSPTRLNECLNEVEDNPTYVLFSWAHLEERYENPDIPNRLTYNTFFPGNNRMHGKIYRRDFLSQHNITFSEEGARANEDIGFNIAVRLCAENEWRKDGIQRVYHGEDAAVVWKVTGPSIVRAENCAFYYRDQNQGMSINGQHAINIARQNKVDNDLILREIYEEMAHMYMFYFATKHARPEFLDNSIRGAALYYINCFKPHGDENPKMLTDIFWDVLSRFVNDPSDPIRLQMVSVDFPGFLNMLEQYCLDNNIQPTANTLSATTIENNGFSYNKNN